MRYGTLKFASDRTEIKILYASYIYIYIYIYIYSQANAFLTIKDHKEDFPNTIKCRVINPACNNLGKVNKRVLDEINTTCREAAGVSQWKSTQDVLRWFTEIHAQNPTKKRGKFVQFDICEFYPSISDKLLKDSLDYAKNHASIDEEEVDLIMACRRSILFNVGKTWIKKDKNFDVTMGAQDGAEIAELTGIYLLKQVEEFLSSVGEKTPRRFVQRWRPCIHRKCQWSLG